MKANLIPEKQTFQRYFQNEHSLFVLTENVFWAALHSSQIRVWIHKCVVYNPFLCVRVGVSMYLHMYANANASMCEGSWWMYAESRHGARSSWTRPVLCYMWIGSPTACVTCADHTQTGVGVKSSTFLHIHFPLPSMSWPLSNLSLFHSTPTSLRVFEANGQDRLTRCSIDVDG